MPGTIWLEADRVRLWDLSEEQGLSVEAILSGGYFGSRPKMAIAKLLSRMRKERGKQKIKFEKFSAPELEKFKQFLLAHPTGYTPQELVGIWNNKVATELVFRGYPTVTHGTLVSYQAEFGVRLERSAVYELAQKKGYHRKGREAQSAKLKKKAKTRLENSRSDLVAANAAAVKRLTGEKRAFQLFPCPHCRYLWLLDTPYFLEVKKSLVTTACSACQRELSLVDSDDDAEAMLRRRVISIYQHNLIQRRGLAAVLAVPKFRRAENRTCKACRHPWPLERAFWPAATSTAGNVCFGSVCRPCSCLHRSLKRRADSGYDLAAFIKAFPAADQVLAGAALPPLSQFRNSITVPRIGLAIAADQAVPKPTTAAAVSMKRQPQLTDAPPKGASVAVAKVTAKPAVVQHRPLPVRAHDHLANFVPERLCRGCMDTKPLTPEHWNIKVEGENPTGGGVNSYCKACIAKSESKTTKKRK